jgi:hypothetical protein
MDLEALRHHEAAHGAAALLLGLPLRVVSIVPRYEARGYVGGYALVRVDPCSSRDAVRPLVATLAGLLEVFDWRESSWGRLDPQRSSDEADIVELIELWGISEQIYEKLLGSTLKLMATKEFDRLLSVIVAVLDYHPVVGESPLKLIEERSLANGH